jgi:glycogen synthase
VRILMTSDTVGGVFTYTSELARALEARGDEVVVATLGAPLRAHQREQLPSEVYQSGFALEWMDGSDDDVEASGRWLAELTSEVAPDVVQLSSYAHGAVDLRVPKIVVGHSCVASWWRAVHGMEAPAAWDGYRRRVRGGLLRADAVVAPTRAMLAELEAIYGIRGGTVIPNGSAAACAPPHVEKRPVVLAAGRFWDAAKNLVALDEAAHGLTWPVVVAGDLGGGKPPSHAVATGSLPTAELAALRRSAAIFAAPSRYEPFGLAILEAARDRCALVLGDIASLREVWGDAARYVDPADPSDLHTTLENLIANPQERGALAALAQRRAAALGIARSARSYQRLYARLVPTARSVMPA